MSVKTGLAAVATSFALAAGLGGCGDVEVAAEHAYCEIKPDAKYPVRIIDADEGHIIHEGGYKRFDMDAEKRTCTYVHNSGDAFVYQMKP
ncbi:MAG: hypothetical protein ACXW30_02880 [Micavibrio sp.]